MPLHHPSSSSEGRCCDYKKLNLLALGGTLVYAGYLLGSVENGAESIVSAVNSAFTNSDSEDRPVGGLRAASPSASWDTRLSNSDSWDIGMGEEDQDDYLELPSAHVEKKVPQSYANGPVINAHDGPVSTINLIGERHSGTNWITDHLEDCFGDQIQVKCRNDTCDLLHQRFNLTHNYIPFMCSNSIGSNQLHSFQALVSSR